MLVRKRNGSIESFNINKLAKSMLSALHSAEEGTDELEKMVTSIVEQCGESVDACFLGDLVEETLMVEGYFDTAKAYILYRNENQQHDLWPKKGILETYIHRAKYARGNESWDDTVHRLFDMHRHHFGEKKREIVVALGTLEELVRNKQLLPSMRSLQFGGQTLLRQNERMYNCAFTHVDRGIVFSEIMYWLLCGSGVAYSVQQHHIDRLMPILKVKGIRHWVIDDTIEGWADAVKILMYEYMVGGHYPEFSYHMIRDKGSKLVTSGGLAPGHEGLRDGIENARKILIRCGGRKMRPIEVYDVICHLVSAVLSGGIRRSATLCLFDDTEMLYAKSGDSWMKENPQRVYSNNSMIILRNDESLRSKMQRILEISQGYGEPGFMFADSREWGINPCGEIGLDPYPNGFAVCNLVECHSDNFFWAGVLGTLQTGYDNVSCKEWIQCNRIMGCSITGLDWSNDELIKGRREVMRGHQWMCEQMGWRSVVHRLTCVKPSGTSSLLMGGIESGIHPHPAKKYLRRVIGDCDAAKRFAEANPHLVEYDGERLYLVFPIRTDKGIQGSISDKEMIQEIIRIKRSWIGHYEYGIIENNISATVTTNDPMGLLDMIVSNKDDLTALSFAPLDVDKKYPFAPRENVDEKNLGFFNILCKELRMPDYSGIDTYNDKGIACEGQKCTI